MTNDVYTLLGFFERAFQRVRAVPTLIHIDCTAPTRYAEGTYKDHTWKIEATPGHAVLQNASDFQKACEQVGDFLLVALYSEIAEEANAKNWGDGLVYGTLAPVLEASGFHFGKAVLRGWIAQDQLGYKGKIEKGVGFSLNEAFAWTNLEVGRWSSSELMEMLICLDGNTNEKLSPDMGDTWVAAHYPEEQDIARNVLNAVFEDRPGSLDYDTMVQAWDAWWTQVGPAEMGESILRLLPDWTGFGDKKKVCACVSGWYLSVGRSVEMAQRAMVNFAETLNGFERAQAWMTVRLQLRQAVQEHPALVWVDKETQAWLLHRSRSKHVDLDAHPAMLNNRVHAHIRISESLNPGMDIHHVYQLWCQAEVFRQHNDELDNANTLFEHPEQTAIPQ